MRKEIFFDIMSKNKGWNIFNINKRRFDKYLNISFW